MKIHLFPLHHHNLRRALRIARNKYALTTLVFAVWVAFFDGNSLLERLTLARKTARLEREALYLARVVADNKQRLHELKTDNDNLEKFAREQYLMKRDNEDIFIVVSD